QRSSGKARMVKELRGTIIVRVVVEKKNVVITEKFLESKGTKINAGDATLEITEARKDKDGYLSVRLEVPPPQTGVRMHWHDRFFLEDAKGNRYSRNGHGTESSGMQHWISVHWGKSNDAKLGPATKLIFEDWVVLHHAIPFVFKDVPLP